MQVQLTNVGRVTSGEEGQGSDKSKSQDFRHRVDNMAVNAGVGTWGTSRVQTWARRVQGALEASKWMFGSDAQRGRGRPGDVLV